MGKLRSKKAVPRERWLPKQLWNKVIRLFPLVCVDMVFQREDGSILYGWRIIEPYKNVWALLGGRILYREDLKRAASRIASEYGLRFRRLYQIGVFPINFRIRSDIVVAVAALDVTGKPIADGFEFTKFAWKKKPPRNLGANYRRMVSKWKQVSKSRDFLRLVRIV